MNECLFWRRFLSDTGRGALLGASSNGLSEWRSGKIDVRNYHQRLSASGRGFDSQVVGSITGQTHSSCNREGDSLGQRRFPSGSPVSSYITLQIAQYCLYILELYNVQVDAQLSIQYFSNRESNVENCTLLQKGHPAVHRPPPPRIRPWSCSESLLVEFWAN
jgi:hypothetical protein